MPDLAELGKNICRLRKAQGLTQEQAAFASGISVYCWQKIEHGYYNTTVDTLRYMAGTLKVLPVTIGIYFKTDKEIRVEICQSLKEDLPADRSLQVGKNILLLRKKRGITQKELAYMSHVSAARLRDIEHDCANVSILVLERIAKSLGVSLFCLGTLSMSEKEILEAVRKTRKAAGIEEFL